MKLRHFTIETSTDVHIERGSMYLHPLRQKKMSLSSAIASVFQLQEELSTPLFADGHVVSIYWENISRSIVERTHRDAKKLNVPLYYLQAADQRASYKKKEHDDIVTHSLLTVPNIHNTGGFPASCSST